MAINPNMAPSVRPLISCWRKYSIPRELPLPSISPFEPGRRPTVVGDNLTHAIDKPQQSRHQAVTVPGYGPWLRPEFESAGGKASSAPEHAIGWRTAWRRAVS